MLSDALNDKQREAVLAEDKRLLVLAGAGSGKTKPLFKRSFTRSVKKHPNHPISWL
jgi:hypothetical protein